MSLFKQLERLHRSDRFQREDFLTEIVAQVLQNSQELTLEWLRSLKVTDLKKATSRVRTQAKFEKLPGHDTDSRPDMLVELFSEDCKELIFIESKVDAMQGGTQLQRYADHLAAEKERKGLTKTSLVFITLDYESATNPRPQDSSFIFRLTRWFEFYQKLKAHSGKNSDGLAEQLKLFMEENHMSVGNQFRSTDLVAMENIISAMALIEETLEGEAVEKAKQILGNAKLEKKDHAQLRTHRRHIVWSDLKNGFECCFGYYFPHENPDEPVWIGIELGASLARNEAIQAFREWVGKSCGSWTIREFNDVAWVSIRKGNSIRSLIGGDDHVGAIKKHLLDLLDEVGRFKTTYPGLSWPTTTPTA